MGALLLLIPLALVIFGLVKLLSGNKKIKTYNSDTEEYKKGMKDLEIGINTFIVISVLLIIGFSMCFGLLAGF
ncbi:hypothetical protein [Urechidicola croceus]|uniref:Uncharacterized protein n=1 Tax=Urechidicola croceus TaxID=1850246 RepID=A0A1D8PAT2_9FLAO|nr:hypothetical protein [Urechidicola croceus]AOW21667.1 hypothetical protein LPB138_13695 [Urechidicola croceus]